MRDKITIDELSDDLKNLIKEHGSGDISEINNKLSVLEEKINQSPTAENLKNYYTKTDIDTKIPKLIESGIATHNGDSSSHSSIQQQIADITSKITSIKMKSSYYNLSATSDNQKEFTIDDSSYVPLSVMSSVLVINGLVIDDYTLTGRTLTLTTQEGVTTNTNILLIVFSIEGV